MAHQVPSWITPEGIDLKRVPLESFISQTFASELEKVGSACRLLEAMAYQGRDEAGVYLLGLLSHYRDDLQRLQRVAQALGGFRSASAAQALFDELRRVKGSNSTRGYLSCVIGALQRLPPDLTREGFQQLADDPAQSYRMRQRCREILWNLPAVANPMKAEHDHLADRHEDTRG